MTSTNVYEKHYLTKSRTKNDDNVYVLILFKCDNTFIIKKKSNLHGIAENGLVTIKDRNKSYVGYCLFEGSLTEVESAAERLDKEMNTDLESDCENIMNNHKVNKQQGFSQSSILKTPNNSSFKIDRSATIKNSKVQKKINNDSIDSTKRSLATTSFDSASKTYETPPILDKAVQNKKVLEASYKQDAASAYQARCDSQCVTEDEETLQSEETLSSYDGADDFETDDDDDSTETMVGITKSLTTAARLKSTSVNQINVALFGGDFDTENQSQSDVPFQQSLSYKKQDGTTVDLLQLYGVRTQIGRFVALVMDHVFTKHELCTITTSELIKDERYNIIRETVRSRFKLDAKQMNIEWPTIHESILQKRRNESKKKNGNTSIVNNNHLPPQ
ncbi:unnamed protein product [Rotaria sp. Silwood1]|nr:unnamed protein product [Rotaria sp. Silwood1]CAF1611223.1 unnamed protein product [Rotaria sp. Silwood1]CAF3693834.1 unnamed protein product [Rotaria sp. Silwood1]CAF3702368.1 unnamed protein product [Rotaria sp. Silwood1]CAF3731807.1 unnamed protein product [Rotaria sp. Silwood1]